MLKIYICEDEPAQREKLADCVRKFILAENYDAEIALATAEPEELLHYICDGKDTGLYFLDVDLQKEINGIQLAEAIRKYDPRGFIIFVTSHSEALPLTFKYKVEAMDYIIKDDAEHFSGRVTSCVSDAYAKHVTLSAGPQPNFVFKMTEQRMASVPLAKIIFIETAPHVPRKIILHTADSFYEFYGKLDDIQKRLEENNFFRCHKSFIINTRAVEMVDRKEGLVYLTGGRKCMASTRRMNELLKKLSAP